jgi:hypothetical protein
VNRRTKTIGFKLFKMTLNEMPLIRTIRAAVKTRSERPKIPLAENIATMKRIDTIILVRGSNL